MTITESDIRNAVRKLKRLEIQPRNGFYEFAIPITPMHEQKMMDYEGFGINRIQDWLALV